MYACTYLFLHGLVAEEEQHKDPFISDIDLPLAQAVEVSLSLFFFSFFFFELQCPSACPSLADVSSFIWRSGSVSILRGVMTIGFQN